METPDDKQLTDLLAAMRAFVPYSIDMSDGPLLVMFLRRGDNLHKKSDF